MEKIEFTKEKIAVMEKISGSIIDSEFAIGIEQGDVLTDTMTVKLKAYIYTCVAEERELIYYTTKPTFMDWLRGRTKRVVFDLKVKDMLLNPPADRENTLRLYSTELSEG